ncbi:DUF2188 domain-containing protein [Cupriavidus necator]|uniref:DUF2188 domain-containing protein n=1 Tax=Cupriavidus necator TaxID=106590 RepID=UPI0039C34A2F
MTSTSYRSETARRLRLRGGLGRETFDSQDEAIAVGKSRAKEKEVELFIHGRDGQIRERNTFGDDPRQIKG